MNLDISNLLLFCLISLVLGAVIMLIVQYFIFLRFFKFADDNLSDSNKKDDDKKSKETTKFSMPEALLNTLNLPDSDEKSSQLKSINLLLQFLFFELHQSHNVRKWFLRKISMELEELLVKTTIGKFFSKLTVSQLDLGTQFPTIKNIDLSNCQLHPIQNHIEKLDILLDVHYKGDFLIQVDANMVLGKKGSLSLKVKQLAGKARLQFTRLPFTHWSLSFTDEPFLDLKIESQIQGRQMQSNLTNLISTAVKKAIRRKHTLPNYKLRFKPFFKRLIFDEIDLPMEYSGTLELTLINLTRLNFPPQLRQVYATITLSSHSWIDAQQLNNENLVITMDVEIHKAKNQQIGIVFKQTERVIIESILPNTPAMLSDLKSDDVLVSIEGKKVNHLSQVAKILKNMTKSVLILRIERIIKGNIKNDAIGEDAADVYEDMNSSMNITFSKKSDTVSIGNENKINEPQHSRDSSAKNTPKSSPKKIVVTTFPQHSTIDCSLTDFIRMNDTTTFNLNPSFKYLNVNIYGRSTSDDNTLLGYLNVPLENVLAECNESNLEYIEKFMLNPPEFTEFTNTTLSQMSGFCSNICFGDISINFKWTQNTSGNRRDTLTHKSSLHGSQEDEGDEPKKHNFIRTSFTRSTQCDFCGKKIWLKDAVQCKDCQMCCHKKCMVRSQVSTICYGSIEQSEFLQLKVTDVDCQDDEDDESIESFKNSGSGHRQSFSDLLSSGIKRVNSANSLNIPTIVSNLSSSNSKSLPPTPQHSSRKPSLTNQNVNPFVIIIQRLEQMQGDKTTMTQDEIQRITGPIENDDLDDLMELAKSSSEQLYIEYDMEERVTKINDLLSKLRVALDCATSSQAVNNRNPSKIESSNSTTESTPKKIINDNQIEKKLQLLSVVMLHLCSGLQSAQSSL